jgi:hypothetical protein
VTDGTNPVSGVTITFSHNAHTETTAADGSYSYAVPWNTSTTITPSHVAYASWAPPSRTLNSISANQPSQAFVGTIRTYTVSGTITSGSNPIQGATVTFSHDGGSVTTGADGAYSRSVNHGTTTTLTPSHVGYGSWTPSTRTLTSITANQPAQDFSCTINTYTISGSVTDGTNPVSGVAITFSHDAHTETTAADGSYSYAVPWNTSTTITPSHVAYASWAPSSRTLNSISANQPSQDFVGTIKTYTVSGTITSGSNPIQGVTVTFSHDGGSVTTGADGAYSRSVNHGTTTTLTPSHVGYGSWTPSTRTLTSITANQSAQDFSCTINTYTISGTVTDGTNPVSGVTITFSHSAHTETTAADGSYSYAVPWNTSTTITPSHVAYASWAPPSRTLNSISANQPSQDFVGTIKTYTVSGTVTSGGNPIQGVTITFSHDGRMATTGADGTYWRSVDHGTTTTLTPSRGGYAGWSPATRTFTNITANQPAQDFSSTINTYAISGTVTDGTNPVSGVTITFSHDAHTETTAADGSYSYAVPWNTSTTITPSHVAYATWAPPSRTLNSISANQPSQGFVGTIKTYTVSGTVTSGGNPIQGVTIAFSHDGGTVTTGADGAYSRSVNHGTTTTLTPSHVGYGSWTPGTRTLNDITANQTGQDFSCTITPEIVVEGNSLDIPAGDTTPRPEDHTDFGEILVAGGTVVHTFTIKNTGSAELILAGATPVTISGTNAADFTVTLQPTSPLSASTGTTNFTVRFDPSATGPRTATISIANNDADENPFDFAIAGTGVVVATAFVPVEPCRMYDTRVDSGASAGSPALSSGERREFAATGRCGIPSDAKAVSINVTAVGATATGDLAVVGGHITSTLSSVLSVPVGRARANNALVQLSIDGDGAIAIINVTAGSLHVIVDVNGYFGYFR